MAFFGSCVPLCMVVISSSCGEDEGSGKLSACAWDLISGGGTYCVVVKCEQLMLCTMAVIETERLSDVVGGFRIRQLVRSVPLVWCGRTFTQISRPISTNHAFDNIGETCAFTWSEPQSTRRSIHKQERIEVFFAGRNFHPSSPLTQHRRTTPTSQPSCRTMTASTTLRYHPYGILRLLNPTPRVRLPNSDSQGRGGVPGPVNCEESSEHRARLSYATTRLLQPVCLDCSSALTEVQGKSP